MIERLGRDLYLLESRCPLLDDLLIPRQAASGENAGKAPVVKMSKPPLVIGVADLILQVERTLGFWCGQVAASADVGAVPGDRCAAVRAAWLGENVGVILELPFAEMMADEVAALAQVVVDVVEPADGEPELQPLEIGGVREVTSWAKHCGQRVHYSTVSRWAKDGKIPSVRTPDGRVLVRLDDVLEKCHELEHSCVQHPR